MTMKCGDVVRNHFASDKNPIRYFIYFRKDAKFVYVIDYDGKQIRQGKYYKDNMDERLDDGTPAYEIVGHIDIKGALMARLESEAANE